MASNKLITLDFGNTNKKAMLHQHGKRYLFPFEEMEHILKQHNLNADNCVAYLSNVGATTPKLALPIIQMDSLRQNDKFLGMPVNYSATLGTDRLLVAYWAFKKKAACEKIIVIDSGTFTTIDLVTDDGFEGGYILPGLHLLKKSYGVSDTLYKFVKEDYQNDNEQLPNQSADAVNQGILKAFISPIQALATEMDANRMILTGGNARLLESSFSLPCEIKKNLIHDAMFLVHQELS